MSFTALWERYARGDRALRLLLAKVLETREFLLEEEDVVGHGIASVLLDLAKENRSHAAAIALVRTGNRRTNTLVAMAIEGFP